MNKRTLYFTAAALGLSLCLGTLAFAAHREKLEVASDLASYTLNLEANDDIVSGKRTENGNLISFVSSGLSSSSGVGALSSGGYLYNATALSGISSVSVTLASGSVDVYYGRNSASNWELGASGVNADFSSIRPNFVKIQATSAAVISAITVKYACVDYQQSGEETGYKVYVNDLPAEAALIDATKPGEGYDKQYKLTLDVYEGDILTFTKNGSSVYPIASGDGNNAYQESSRGYLAVRSSSHNADLYFKVTGSSYDVWLTGYGSSYGASSLQDGTILHAFNWSTATVLSHLDEIADAGYGAIQLSPMQITQGVYAGGLWSNEWTKLYRPHGLGLAENSDCSVLGTKSDLKALCAAAKEKGLAIIMDVNGDHLDGSAYNSFDSRVGTHEPTIYNGNGSRYRHDYGQRSDDSQLQTIRYSLGGYPDLKTEDNYVMSRVLDLLKECLDCGVTGFRFDAAKHIETPFDGAYASSFWPYVINGAKRYAAKKGYDPVYAYGEALGAGNDRDINWYAPYMSITEGSNSYDLRDGVNNKDISKITGNYYNGMNSPKKHVLWAESHDLYIDNHTRYLSEESINKVYAIQASRSEATALYFARPYDDTALGNIGTTWYKDSVVSAVNKFHATYAGQSEYVSVNSGSFVNVRGSSGAVIVNITNSGSYSVNLPNMSNGQYKDLVSGNIITVSGNYATVNPSYGVCVLMPQNAPVGAYDYYLIGDTTFTGTSASWTTSSGVKMSKGGDNLAYVEGIEVASGAEAKIVRAYASGGDFDWFAVNLGSSYSYCEVQNDNLHFNEEGTYNIYLNTDGVYYVTKQSGGASSSEPPVSSTPSSNYTYSVTGLPDWVTNNGCVIFAWAWGGEASGGKWYSLDYSSSTSVSFAVSTELDGFLLARCKAGTTTPDWGIKTDVAGRIYNKTGDIHCVSRTYSYASPEWLNN